MFFEADKLTWLNEPLQTIAAQLVGRWMGGCCVGSRKQFPSTWIVLQGMAEHPPPKKNAIPKSAQQRSA